MRRRDIIEVAMKRRDLIELFKRPFFIIASSVFIIVVIFQLAAAGLLTPSAAPAPTMNTLEETYDVLIGGFNSAAITASRSGGAIEVSKCLVQKITGQSPCP
jgi:hypothetical protein